MNKLFFILLFALVGASVYTYLSEPEQQKEYPLLHWKSDSNPERQVQIELFHQWLLKYHPELSKKPGQLPFGLEHDTANNQSVLIQAVSGVGGDLLDAIPVPVYSAMGLTCDLTSYAEKGGFSLQNTYPTVAGLLTYENRLYGYPCNLAVGGMVSNLDTFDQYGVPHPPEHWTLDEFEKLGKEFVKKANEGKEKQDVFFTSAASTLGSGMALTVSRSRGVDLYNETLTDVQLDKPEAAYVETFERLHQWTYVDHILPTAAEVASANVESGGYGGVNLTQFINGKYGMTCIGRYLLIRLREHITNVNKGRQLEYEEAVAAGEKVEKPTPFTINLMTSATPQDEYKNMLITARATVLYAGSKHKEKAVQFFSFLASKEYNQNIIDNADGLPPNPAYVIGNPEYETPKDWPNEGNLHKSEAQWAMTIAVPGATSPYVMSTGNDWIGKALDKSMNDRMTAKDAIQEAADRLRWTIQQSIDENPKLKRKYNADLALQKKIDEYKAAGKKIPANWVKNPFYQKYYKDKGMLAPAAQTEQEGTK